MIFCEYEKLYRLSGLRLNAEKTETLSATPFINPLTVSYNNRYVNVCSVDKVKICGNVLTCDNKLDYEENVKSKIAVLEKQLNLWGKRNISIEGKMLIVKTFAMSQLVFISQCMNINNK